MTTAALSRHANEPPLGAIRPDEPRGHAAGEAMWFSTCVIAFLASCWLLRDFVADDAWISARYANNLATGLGAVWNPSGPRVEGFSNPLLVGVEALARLLGASPVDAARAIGVASGVGLLLVIHRLGAEVVGAGAARIALGLTAFCPPLALWAVGGLETLPTALAMTAGVLLLSRPHADRRDAVRAGAVLALLPWLRPEGLAVALAVALFAQAPRLLRRDGRRTGLARGAVAAGLPLASQLMLEGLRLAIFAHPLPNSVLYKSGSGAGLEVLAKFAGEAAPLIAVAAAGLVLARGRQRLLAVPALVYALGSNGTLDSANAFSRFFLPVWPQLALLAGLAIAVIQARSGRRGPAVAVAVAAGAALVLAVSLGLSTHAFAGRYASCRLQARVQAAAWLRAHTPRDTTFSISDAGLVPAQAGGRTAIDQFLLNEPALQETGPLGIRRRVDMTFHRQPDVLVLASTDAARFHGYYATDRQMELDPRRRPYRLATVTGNNRRGCGYHLFIYR